MASVFPVQGYVAENRRSFARIDWWLVVSSALLLLMGLMSLYSQASTSGSPYFHKQLTYALMGLAPFALFALVHPRVWTRLRVPLYLLSVGTLTFVLVHGHHVKGAGRWIKLGPIDFQPSELAKILTVLTLASFYSMRQDKLDKPSTCFLGFAHVLIPAALILKQPHLGAALVMLVMGFAVTLASGVSARSIFMTSAAVFGLAMFFLAVPGLRGLVVHDYQIERILSLEKVQEGQKDVRRGSYQTDQAEIAFGLGGVFGEGFMQGEQKANGFVPEQENDFVITIIGEEGGLVGCSLVLLAFGFFFYRVWLTMVQSAEPFHKMIAGGIFAVLGFHMFVNFGMVLQLLPVVGLWLPFFSCGGTAIWLCMSCVGLLVGVQRRERPILF